MADADLSGEFDFRLIDSMSGPNHRCHLRYFDAEAQACLEIVSSSKKTRTYYYLAGEHQEFTDIDSFTDHVHAVRRRDPTTLEVGRLRAMLKENGINPDNGAKTDD